MKIHSHLDTVSCNIGFTPTLFDELFRQGSWKRGAFRGGFAATGRRHGRIAQTQACKQPTTLLLQATLMNIWSLLSCVLTCQRTLAIRSARNVLKRRFRSHCCSLQCLCCTSTLSVEHSQSRNDGKYMCYGIHCPRKGQLSREKNTTNQLWQNMSSHWPMLALLETNNMLPVLELFTPGTVGKQIQCQHPGFQHLYFYTSL